MTDLLAYFPICVEPSCPKGADPHKHIYPAQEELILAREKYVASVGGLASGKTLAASILGHLLCLAIPGNRGLVIRASYPKLNDSTLRIFMEVIEREVQLSGHRFKYRERRDGWPHRILYEHGSEVVFRESSDHTRFLGPEYGWWWIDEAVDEPVETFTSLIKRLRLPMASGKLKGLLTTNPPNHRHWIAEKFGQDPGVTRRGDSSFRLIRSSTLDNTALDGTYVSDLKANLPAAEVSRVLEGHWGFPHEGKPVYAPPFEHRAHIGEPTPRRTVDGHPSPMVRGWDFGWHCPVVTWHQFTRCPAGQSHWTLHHEYVGKDLEAETLADTILTMSAISFPGAMMEDIGDAAGIQPGDKGPGPIARLARPPWNLRFQYRKFPNIDPGIALIREALATRCHCGAQTFTVHRRCAQAIDMLAGGYHYLPEKAGRAPVIKPHKDGLYDNLADSIRYVGELAFRLARLDPRTMDALLAYKKPKEMWKSYGADDPWARLDVPGDPMRHS